MAAGSEGASGRNSGSSPALESTLDRRFQTINNTMESIQGLSVWCIENKKYHSVIVRYWLRWLRKSDSSHRLNLFYLANDVIQNCKRKNAIVYRTTFTDVLPEAMKLLSAVKDAKVTKSAERILKIWEERNVYSEEFIRQLKSSLIRVETQKEPVKAVVNTTNAALKSKIVAEFVPSAFIEHLSKYRKSMDQVDLKEKQLAAMRVDVCSTEALKKLKDKAGGKRFSKDFEDGSTKLQDFVSFLDGEVKKGPPLIEALENADIFYEMQYKEVKIVAKAYETFANRVSHLKRKLDSLKAMVPDPNDSPVPSPIEDAPSPSGSESPFHILGTTGDPDPELDGQEMDDDMIALVDAPSPLSSVGGSPKPSISVGEADNRDVEDMDLSDVEEAETHNIIVEELEAPSVASKPQSAPQNITETSPPNEAPQTKQITTPTPPVSSATPSLPVNLAGVDLGKISSILSTLTNVMKNSAVGVSPVSRTSPSVPSTPSSALTTPVAAALPANPLANILSRVDINPSTLLSALSKTQPHGGLQGLSSLLSNQAAKTPATSTSDSEKSPLTPLTSHAHESPNVTPTPSAIQLATDPQASMAPKSSQSDMVNENVNSSSLNSTLDTKIDSFLHGNPGMKGFNMGFPSVLSWAKGTVDSPIASADNLVGTPVRDEAGSTPTQDEIMDVPRPEQSMYQQGLSVSTDAKSTLPLASWQDPNSHTDPRLQSGAEIHQNVRQPKNDFRNSVPSLAEAEAKRHQLIEAMLSNSKPDKQQSSHNKTEATTRPGQIHQEQRQNPVNTRPNSEPPSRSMYVDPYKDSQEQQVLASSDGYGANPYHVKELRKDHNAPNFFTTPLPPIPTLPPPPQDFITPVSSSRTGGPHVPLEKPYSEAEVGGGDESYIHDNSAYGEHLAHEEPFHPHGDRPAHFAPPPHHVPKIPQNASVDYNHQHPPRAPLQHPPHHHLGPRPVPDDPYFDPYYDHPPRSPSPPRYDMSPFSPHTHEHYPEDAPPHYPDLRVPPPHLEHRPRPPHPVRLPHPHPGHYPPPRPLRRPPPGPYTHEPPFPRGKRPGPPFGGPPRGGGPFFPPKRPYLPPHY